MSLVVGNADKIDNLSQEEVMDFLTRRRKVLEGVCVTGGEPLLQSGVVEFLEQVKELGYKVKLDTNGAFPDRLRNLVNAKLVDYVAMDVKNSPALYNKTCGCVVEMSNICSSVDFLKSGAVDYEFRTTVTGTFHSEKSIEDTAQWLAGAKRWYLQQFVDSGELIDSTVVGVEDDTLRKYQKIAQKYVPSTQVRGIK